MCVREVRFSFEIRFSFDCFFHMYVRQVRFSFAFLFYVRERKKGEEFNYLSMGWGGIYPITYLPTEYIHAYLTNQPIFFIFFIIFSHLFTYSFISGIRASFEQQTKREKPPKKKKKSK